MITALIAYTDMQIPSAPQFGCLRGHPENEQYYTLSSAYALFADSNFTKGVATCTDFLGPAYLASPRHLVSTKYQNPTDPKNTAFQDAFQCKDKDLFGILMEKPDTAQGFATLMNTWGEGNSLAPDLFPMGQFLADGDTSISATWVDVGGGYGQKTVALKSSFLELQGRFIVRDQPHIINGAVKNEGIEYLIHDCFTEQPIKARAYYIRQVLHDFPDGQCVPILTELRKAMKPGYSQLFIHEQMIPRSGASTWAVAQDFNMMTLPGAERTQDQFIDILHRSGLKGLGFYPAPDGVSEGLVEAEVMD
ncbi:hypothetical protein NHQ30_004921 [Ciborinia camelliae]|nr:hypothetical protein NHQ30_004921 [Ciborinia camelliae]